MMRNLFLTVIIATTALAAGSSIGAKAAPSSVQLSAPVANALIQPAHWNGRFRDRDDRFFFHRRFHRHLLFDEFRPFHRRFFFHRRFRDCDFDDPC